MAKEQTIRKILFYSSVIIFFVGLPIILSSAVGYRFDRKTFKFTKTGFISLKTIPIGAKVYINDRPFLEKTPCLIAELMPDIYKLEISLPGYYPYTTAVMVEAGKVTRLEKIILFPLRPDVEQVNKEPLMAYWLDLQKGFIFYVDEQNKAIYKADLFTEHFEHFADYMPLSQDPFKWELSADRKKLMYCNSRQIGIIYLRPQDAEFEQTKFIIQYPHSIRDIFWHSDSYYLIVVTEKTIDMLEARPNALPQTIVKLKHHKTYASYDIKSDTLYFTDTEEAADGRQYLNLYRLDLKPRKLYSIIEDLIKKRHTVE
ncbi:MAG: PEGA domain-containing protein [Candidatus Omnitrophica bacterium]|nr:PEGA domain-containing protein [Candidatus Omnitrophota bacterium]